MNFFDTLRRLPLRNQVMLAGAMLAVVLAMTVMVRGAMKEPMALLYSGLDAERAGEIISELDSRNVAYDITQDSIFVPRNERDRIRFSLAQEGLPKQAVKGYELLDDVNGFSVTSEMYNASYWRAKEGELTRTILAIPGIASARVHIGASLRSGFARSAPAQTASVTLSTSQPMSANQAEAVQYLVALAVSGLKPSDVAVIDPEFGILAGPNSDKTKQPSISADDQATTLESKVARLLEARVGPGNSQVSVSVDVTRERELISAVRFDPDSRVVRQRTTNDASEEGSGGGGAVTVASNLPQGGAGSGSSTNAKKNSSESVSYELNEVRTETERLPGQVKRISIAVMLNEQALGIDPAADGAVEQANAIADEFTNLISTAVGLNDERGDSITVELMPFREIVVDDLIAAPSMVATMMERYMWSGIQVLLLSLVVIALGFGVIRPILSQKGSEVLPAPTGMPAIAGPNAAVGAATAAPATAAPGVAPQQSAGASAPTAPGAAPADEFEYLKGYATEREDETAALLQEWLTEDLKVAVNE